jgi:hypothetical protein
MPMRYARAWDAELLFARQKSSASAKFWSASENDAVAEIRIESWPVSDLLLLVQLYSGRKIDSANSAVPIAGGQLGENWRKLKGKYPGEFSATH